MFCQSLADARLVTSTNSRLSPCEVLVHLVINTHTLTLDESAKRGATLQRTAQLSLAGEVQNSDDPWDTRRKTEVFLLQTTFDAA
jgi:hypothetical protein